MEGERRKGGRKGGEVNGEAEGERREGRNGEKLKERHIDLPMYMGGIREREECLEQRCNSHSIELQQLHALAVATDSTTRIQDTYPYPHIHSNDSTILMT